MKKNRKKILGALGLIFVVVMTLVASVIPSPSVDATSSSITQTIRVIVYDEQPAVHILSPENDSTTINPSMAISFSYENVSRVDFALKYQVGDVWTTYNLSSFYPENRDPIYNIASGIATLPAIDLDVIHGYGDYILVATGIGGGAYYEDTIEFSFSSLAVDNAGIANNNDPIVNVRYSSSFSSFYIYVLDENGRELFDEPIEYTIEDAGNSGSKDFTLPFESFGATAGTYTVAVAGYFAGSNPQEDEADTYAYLNLNYTPLPSPDVPKTGLFTRAISIAKSDYLITLMVAFLLTIAISVYFLVHKKEQKKNRRRR